MTEQDLQALLARVKEDPVLAEKIGSAPDAETYVAVAKEAGFELSVEELELEKSTLSEIELESGGGATTYPSQACRNTCPNSTCLGC